jgi:hypothetical protein
MPDIVKHEEKPDFLVLAKNSSEMAKAQDRTIKGFKAKVEIEKGRMLDLQANLEVAKKNKWRTETLKRHITYAKERVAFYEKIVNALEAGFQIIPEMDIDVFAIRTTAKSPRSNTVTGQVQSWNDGPSPSAQKTNHPPTGEGEYVAPDRVFTDETRFENEKKSSDGTKVEKQEMVTRWATDFAEIEFPFQLARTEILEMTAAAMHKKVFDELGILPRRPSTDPMVVGRISLKGRPNYNRKSVNFMVAWFLDLSDI